MTDSPSLARDNCLERIAHKDAHTMRDAFDIGEALTALAEAGAMLTVYPAGDAPPLPAHIASVEPDAPRFALALSGNGPLPPGRATFVAPLPNAARLQFELDSDCAT